MAFREEGVTTGDGRAHADIVTSGIENGFNNITGNYDIDELSYIALGTGMNFGNAISLKENLQSQHRERNLQEILSAHCCLLLLL